MSQIPAGWYPDPAPRQPGAPQGQRWWDGQQWTEHVHPAQPGQPQQQPQPEQQQPQEPEQTAPYPAGYGQQQPGGYPGQYASHYGQQPSAYPGQYGQSAAEAQQASQMPAAYPGQSPQPYPSAPPTSAYSMETPTTPDGEPLSGWWARVGAYVIDWFIRGIITGAIGFQAERHIATVASAWFHRAMTVTQNNGTLPDTSGLTSQIAGAALVIAAIALGVRFVYNVGFLKWKQATPGMLALGLRVRLRERPGPLSWATVLKRWITQFWGAIVRFVPLLGSVIGFIWWIVDDLWPLWDDKRQALHDKAAATNVVRVRR
jgi:uncharacterized RDD family membrane protein YckC